MCLQEVQEWMSSFWNLGLHSSTKHRLQREQRPMSLTRAGLVPNQRTSPSDSIWKCDPILDVPGRAEEAGGK